ncbi:MAG: hypothetical protein OXB91_06290 [Bryobacterales bacterium]|nr:hypothetical protein [Bryobacterales bacterium]
MEDTPHLPESEVEDAPEEARHWNRIYVLVLAHLGLWIVGLWAVSRFLGDAS